LGVDSRSNAVVAAVIAMSRALDLRVVAEGVETRRQMEILQFLGCTQMQGYHFAHPLDPPDFEGFHAAVHRRPMGKWDADA
jgi:EAL domain-containing protein (putative c-di-GMP-specific phosphodiesterase class I)